MDLHHNPPVICVPLIWMGNLTVDFESMMRNTIVTCYYFAMESPWIPRQTAKTQIRTIEMGLICAKKHGEIHHSAFLQSAS